MELLTTEGWFGQVHDCLGESINCDDVWIPEYSPGTMFWAPPPGGARHSLE